MNNYHEKAARNIAIKEDHNGLFCTIPSEMDSERCYELRCIESAHEVVVCNCTCKGFSYYRRCKHVGIVQAMWNRTYKSNTKVNTSQFATKKAAPVAKRTPLVRKVRNGGLVLVKVPAKVEQVATEVGITVEQVQEIAAIAADYQQEIKPKHTEMTLPIGPRDTKKDIVRKSTDISNEGSLYSNKGFSILR